MQTKLTLRLDDKLIKEAKAWARARGISLSQAVAGFFAQLTELPNNELAPWTRQLLGVARSKDGEAPPSDEQVRSDYLDSLETKHR